MNNESNGNNENVGKKDQEDDYFTLPQSIDETDLPIVLNNDVDLEKLAFGDEGNNNKRKNKFRTPKIYEMNQKDEEPVRQRQNRAMKLWKKALKSSDKLIRKTRKILNKEMKIWKQLFLDMMVVIRKDYLGINSFKNGDLFIYLGMACAFLAESFLGSPRYNIIMLFVLIVAEKFRNFPTRSVRPQIFISVASALSILMDVIYIISARGTYKIVIIILIIGTLLGKSFAIYRFLMNAQGTMRARKYLIRRIRLFAFPFSFPKRIMRDVRGRFLALAWMHFFGAIMYFSLFILSITVFGYNVMFLSSSTVTLSMFLLFKFITTLIVFVALFSDINMILCLTYFGCLGCAMGYVKNYIRNFREKYGGWPYPFAFNFTRLQMFTIVKAVDFLWSISGWISINVMIEHRFSTLESSLQGFLIIVILTIMATDIWAVLLWMYAFWLYGKYRILISEGETIDSDDSELDEFHIRSKKKVSKKYPGYILRKPLRNDHHHLMSEPRSNGSDDSDSNSDSNDDSNSDRELAERRGAKIKVVDEDNDEDFDDDEKDYGEYVVDDEDDSKMIQEAEELLRKSTHVSHSKTRKSKTSKISLQNDGNIKNNISQISNSVKDVEAQQISSRTDTPCNNVESMSLQEQSFEKLNIPSKLLSSPLESSTNVLMTPRSFRSDISTKESASFTLPSKPGDDFLPQRHFLTQSPQIPKRLVNIIPPSVGIKKYGNNMKDEGYYLAKNSITGVSQVIHTSALPLISQDHNESLVFIGASESIATKMPKSLLMSSRSETLENRLILDPTSRIEPVSFDTLWNHLSFAAQFSCTVKVSAKSNWSSFSAIHEVVVVHLEALGFYLVNQELESPQSCHFLFFVSGYLVPESLSSSLDIQPIFCLMEMNLSTTDDTERVPLRQAVWSLQVSMKSTDEKQTSKFIAELRLGDVLDLQ